MAWTIEFTDAAKRQLRKLDRQAARRISSFLEGRVAPSSNPRSIGAAMKGPEFGEFWKYRVGDYRIICRIEDQRLVVQVMLGDRKVVYKR